VCLHVCLPLFVCSVFEEWVGGGVLVGGQKGDGAGTDIHICICTVLWSVRTYGNMATLTVVP